MSTTSTVPLSGADSNSVVDAAVRSISHIATLPEITLKIISLVEDHNSTAQDLHKVIANDPAMCSRILKVVNSAFYGLPRQIGSINRAIVLLGLNAVKNIAIAASLTKLFRGGQLCPRFSAKQLWIHSMAVGSASKLVCDDLKLGLPDEAFLAGLIHDIGLMVEMQAAREKLVSIFQQMQFTSDGTPLTDLRAIEQSVLGADHGVFGAALCDAWKFPKSFAYVAGHHHDPFQLPSGQRTLACVVHVSDCLAAQLGYGFRGDIVNPAVSNDVLNELGMSPTTLEAIKAAMPRIYDDVQATFG